MPVPARVWLPMKFSTPHSQSLLRPSVIAPSKLNPLRMSTRVPSVDVNPATFSVPTLTFTPASVTPSRKPSPRKVMRAASLLLTTPPTTPLLWKLIRLPPVSVSTFVLVMVTFCTYSPSWVDFHSPLSFVQ